MPASVPRDSKAVLKDEIPGQNHVGSRHRSRAGAAGLSILRAAAVGRATSLLSRRRRRSSSFR